jgi:hypothetical protein
MAIGLVLGASVSLTWFLKEGPSIRLPLRAQNIHGASRRTVFTLHPLFGPDLAADL